MYTEFYRLNAQPFQLTPDARFYFGSSVHTKAMAHLTYGLSQGEGFIVITGDVGAGKTTLVAHLLSTLDSSQCVAANIVSSQLGADDMLRMVASAFDIPHESTDKATLLKNIETFFLEHQKEGRRCLLMIDEAQNVPVPALEELRMLSNYQANGRATLQSFLLGQPQFRRTLASSDLDQLRQRVIASYHLGPIDNRETRDYVVHRLNAVEWNNDPEFTVDAFNEIYQHTGGVPRRINVLCSRILLFGFLEELHRIDGAMVCQVAEDLLRESELVLETPGPAAVAPLPEQFAAAANPLASQSSTASAQPALVPDAANLVSSETEIALAELLRRMDMVEAHVQRHERTLHRALETVSHYMEILSSDRKQEDGE